MNHKKTFLIAAVLSISALTAWELYWRSQGKVPTLQNDKDLFAVQRAKLDKLTKDDYVIVGDSRIMFDVQLAVWETQTGKRPLQLAMCGTTPLPMFRDIVRNSNFNGTVLVSVTPDIFFATIRQDDPLVNGIQHQIEYYYKRTYAQRFNHWLSLPLQRNLATIHSYEEIMAGNFDLRSLLESIRIDNRTKQAVLPPFYEFATLTEDRNTRMIERVVNDSAFANSIIKVWHFFGEMENNIPPPDKEGTITYFLDDLKLFKERGGKVILVRCPSSGTYRSLEAKNFPRAHFWDELVKKAKVPAYHFEDYEVFKMLPCPEESHLSASDADFFTAELVKLLKADGVIPNLKTN